ncbi:hypothetical protein AB4097_08930 [Microvirga sp. 2MCAF35]|uniref:hypothetical protein n=1 Tax=Microvirga sp. 2MCAF35 TaxID=3232987 RepID=UPI003F9CB95B
MDTAIELIASKIGKKPTKRTDALQVLVEGLISYGGNTKAEQRLARRLYNRDVQAIKHLISKKVTPSNVVAMGLMPGEGLDSWSRQNSKPRKLKKPKPRDKGYFLEIIYLTEEGGTECRARLELTDVTDKRLETFIAAFSPSFSLKTMANSSRPSNVSSDEEDEDAEPDS